MKSSGLSSRHRHPPPLQRVQPHDLVSHLLASFCRFEKISHFGSMTTIELGQLSRSGNTTLTPLPPPVRLKVAQFTASPAPPAAGWDSQRVLTQAPEIVGMPICTAHAGNQSTTPAIQPGR